MIRLQCAIAATFSYCAHRQGNHMGTPLSRRSHDGMDGSWSLFDNPDNYSVHTFPIVTVGCFQVPDTTLQSMELVSEVRDFPF